MTTNLSKFQPTLLPSLVMTLALTLAFSSSAKADPLQDCLDKSAAASAKKSATNSTSTPSNTKVSFEKVSVGELTGRCDERGDLAAVKHALRYQLARCSESRPFDKQTFQLGCQALKRSEWCEQTNRKMLTIADSSSDFKTFLSRVRSEFDWYKSSGMSEATSDGKYARGETQFTAYYTPVIKASRVKTATFKYPIYAKPAELVEVNEASPGNCGRSPSGKLIGWCRKTSNGTYSPYFTRAQIDAGALKGRGLEIAYLQSQLEIYFVMIQGSALLEVDKADGKKEFIRANYAAKNGRQLQMLGRVVRCDGGTKSDFSSMDGIKNYMLKQTPERAETLLAYDQSYIFFRELPDGPLGSEEIPVTRYHSLAVDRSVVPPGAAVLFDLEKTQKNPSCPRFTSFALAQDTGGAIRGAHIDWYVGAGDTAAKLASAMDNAGSVYVALPHGAGTAVPGCR